MLDAAKPLYEVAMNSPIFSELLLPKRRLTIVCLAPLPQNRHQQSLGPMMSRLELVTNSWEMAMVRESATALKSHSALKMSLKLFDSCPSWCLGLGEFMEPLLFFIYMWSSGVSKIFPAEGGWLTTWKVSQTSPFCSHK